MELFFKLWKDLGSRNKYEVITILIFAINFSIIYNNFYKKYNFYSFKTNSKVIEI